jgi:hypothetical protein
MTDLKIKMPNYRCRKELGSNRDCIGKKKRECDFVPQSELDEVATGK